MADQDQPSKTAAADASTAEASPKDRPDTQPAADKSDNKPRAEAKAERPDRTAQGQARPKDDRGNEPEKEGSGAVAKPERASGAGRKAAESDEPSEPSETGELKKDQPTPIISVEDKKIDDLIARVSANEAKIEQLLAVNREMSLFFAEQMEAVEALRKAANAVQGFIESDATLKKKFDKYIQTAKEQETDPAEVQKAVRMRGTLSRLERTGIL